MGAMITWMYHYEKTWLKSWGCRTDVFLINIFKAMRLSVQILLLMFPICLAAQSKDDFRDVLPALSPDTAKPYALRSSGQIDRVDASKRFLARLTNLPQAVMKHHPEILAVYDFDNDGRLEVFIAWYLRDTYQTHMQVYKIDSNQTARLAFDSELNHSSIMIDFPNRSTNVITNAAIVLGQQGAYWCTFYVLFPDCKRLVKLGDASNLKLADLDGDGAYEWILWQWRGFDRRCEIYFIGGQSTDVFRLVSEKFIKIWPPKGWATQSGESGDIGQVMNRFYDMDDDGCPEIITATDVRGKTQSRLSIYKLREEGFRCIAYADFPSKYALTEIMGVRHLKDRKQIVLRLTDAAKCKDEKDVLGAVDFKGRELQPPWINQTIYIDRDVQAKVRDVDGDGEEEAIFAEDRYDAKKVHQPLILRGFNRLLPYSPSK